MRKNKIISRRQFLSRSVKSAGALAAVPYVVPSSVLGRGSTPPSEKITLGAIGNGGRCRHVLKHFMQFEDVRCLAVCDARRKRRLDAKDRVDKQYNNNDCRAYDDLRDLLARDDIDAVLIATGDRMHAIASILAAKSGKDIYSEKPMSLTIEEGRALVRTMNRFGAVYQCGHQRRSVDSYRFQVEVVRRGLIGKVHTIIARMWKGKIIPPESPQPVPDGFDYDMWLGPTPFHPYSPTRVKYWNNYWDTGGGVMIAMGCHYTDIAQWGLDKDDTGPIKYESRTEYSRKNSFEAPVTAEVNCTYPDGVNLVLQSQGDFNDRFIRFVGADGWIQVDDATNLMTAEPKSILKMRGISAGGYRKTGDHIRNFLDCIKTRQETTC